MTDTPHQPIVARVVLKAKRCEERHDALAELKLPGVKDVLFGERFRHRGLPGSLLALDEAVAHNVARDQRPGGETAAVAIAPPRLHLECLHGVWRRGRLLPPRRRYRGRCRLRRGRRRWRQCSQCRCACSALWNARHSLIQALQRLPGDVRTARSIGAVKLADGRLGAGVIVVHLAHRQKHLAPGEPAAVFLAWIDPAQYGGPKLSLAGVSSRGTTRQVRHE